MYFILRAPPIVNEDGELLAQIQNHDEVGDVWDWHSGEPLDDDERASIPVPISMRLERYRGYEGPPHDLRDIGVSVMSRRLYERLANEGVSNLEVFPVALADPMGMVRDYVAFNLIGSAAAIDLRQSKVSSVDGIMRADVSIEQLALDESKLGGVLMCRLAENLGTILVHERLRTVLEAPGVTGLELMRPEDYVQV